MPDALPELAITGPTLSDFEHARERVSTAIAVTPMESSRFLGDLLGSPVYLNAEEKSRGVVAASAGNHAQGVALAARQLGIAATIFMPVGVALPKLQATRDYGAEVVLHGTVVDE